MTPRFELSSGALLVALVAACSNVAGASGAGAACAEADGAPVGAPGPEAGDDDTSAANACAPPDSDGLSGGCTRFEVTVDDQGFSPRVLKAQNVGSVSLTLTNAGTRPHDLVFGCLPLALPGCPAQSCFPATANVPPLAPGETATTVFVVPYAEGIYGVSSDAPGDVEMLGDGGTTALFAQFVVQ